MSQIITRDAIVEAAIAIGDEKGLERVSMRAVAGRLGVQAMSLYHHVRNKAELLDAIHEHLILELTLPSESPTWEAALRSAAGAYRALALRHPTLFVLVATRPISTPAEIAHIAPALTVFDEAGIPPEQQLFSVQSFFCALNGYLLAEVAPTPGHVEVPRPARRSPFCLDAPRFPRQPAASWHGGRELPRRFLRRFRRCLPHRTG